MAIFSRLGHYSSTGILIMRIALGALMITHGYNKLMGGPEKWEKLGGAIGNFGIHAYPTFWGFMAAFSESICALFIILGLWFRPACILLTITMIVAASVHIKKGDPLGDMELALIYAFTFCGLMFIGPGKLSVDKD